MSNDYQSGAAQSAQMSHAELIEALRSHGQMNIDSEKDKPEFGLLTVEGRIMKTYADDLDAAHKREIDEAERRANHAAMKNVSETLAKVGPLYDAESIGNTAKLREALKLCLRGMCGYCRMDAEARGMTTECVNGCEVMLDAKAALAAPPRNCDVGAVREQLVQYTKFCYAHRSPEKGCGGCPLCGEPCCELAWAQMPYESEAQA